MGPKIKNFLLSLFQRRVISPERLFGHLVTRLSVPRTVLGHCTHEPCLLGARAGANLFLAEAGANPRDVEEKTEEGRGETLESCKRIFRECEWEIWDGPSRYFNG